MQDGDGAPSLATMREPLGRRLGWWCAAVRAASIAPPGRQQHGRGRGAGRALHRDACIACGGVPGSLRPDGGSDGAGAGAAQAYSNSLVDFHMVLDLLPGLAGAFFSRALPANLTWGQVRPPPPLLLINTHTPFPLRCRRQNCTA